MHISAFFSFIFFFLFHMQDSVVTADGKIVQRTRCHVYSRVMGFIRPVQFFNNGKKSEFYSRTYFSAVPGMEMEINTNLFKDAPKAMFVATDIKVPCMCE